MCATRGFRYSAMRLIAPPFPAASRPSKTTTRRSPLTRTHSFSFTSSAWSRCSSRSYSFRGTLVAWSCVTRRRLRRRDCGGLVAREAARDDLRDPVAAHRHAVEDVRRLHRPLLVRDHDELRAVGVAPQQLDEAADVRVVQRRLHLVQEVERAGPGEEERKQE